MVVLQTPSLVQNIIVLIFLSLPFIIVITFIGVLIKIVFSKSSRQSTKKIASLFLTLLLSSIIVFATLYLPKTIYEPNEQRHITCGAPFQFLKITSYANPPLPLEQSCIGWIDSPMDTPKTFLWGKFFMNVTIFFSFMWGSIYLVQKFYRLKRIGR